MDEKKVREAIEDFKELSIQMRERGFRGASKHCDLAIEALEKQLAIKPKEVVGGIYREFYECKNCGSEIEPLDIYADYCKWCGQRLDWTKSYTRFIQDSNKS
ncbi:MAG: hypothetical protein KHW68_08760 [Lachnospiraceae bacterium]|nr:hypothetical protein [Lachnospiraceae bacterium]